MKPWEGRGCLWLLLLCALQLVGATSTGDCYPHLLASDMNEDGKLSPTEFVVAVDSIAGGHFKNIFLIRFESLPQNLQAVYYELACKCPGGGNNCCEDHEIDIGTGGLVSQETCLMIDMALRYAGVADTGEEIELRPPDDSMNDLLGRQGEVLIPLDISSAFVIANDVGLTAAALIPGVASYENLTFAYDVLAEQVVAFLIEQPGAADVQYVLDSGTLDEIYDMDCPPPRVEGTFCQSVFASMTITLNQTAEDEAVAVTREYTETLQFIIGDGYLQEALDLVSSNETNLFVDGEADAVRPATPPSGNTTTGTTNNTNTGTNTGTNTTNPSNATNTTDLTIPEPIPVTLENMFFTSNTANLTAANLTQNSTYFQDLDDAYNAMLDLLYGNLTDGNFSLLELDGVRLVEIVDVSCDADGITSTNNMSVCQAVTAEHNVTVDFGDFISLFVGALGEFNVSNITGIEDGSGFFSNLTGFFFAELADEFSNITDDLIDGFTNLTDGAIEVGYLQLVLDILYPEFPLTIGTSPSNTSSAVITVSNSFQISNGQDLSARLLQPGNLFHDGIEFAYNFMNNGLVDGLPGVEYAPFSADLVEIVDTPCPSYAANPTNGSLSCQNVSATYTVELTLEALTAIEPTETFFAAVTQDAIETGVWQSTLMSVDNAAFFSVIIAPIEPTSAPVQPPLGRQFISVTTFFTVSTDAPAGDASAIEELRDSLLEAYSNASGVSVNSVSTLYSPNFNGSIVGDVVLDLDPTECLGGTLFDTCFLVTAGYNVSWTGYPSQQSFFEQELEQGVNTEVRAPSFLESSNLPSISLSIEDVGSPPTFAPAVAPTGVDPESLSASISTFFFVSTNSTPNGTEELTSALANGYSVVTESAVRRLNITVPDFGVAVAPNSTAVNLTPTSCLASGTYNMTCFAVAAEFNVTWTQQSANESIIVGILGASTNDAIETGVLAELLDIPVSVVNATSSAPRRAEIWFAFTASTDAQNASDFLLEQLGQVVATLNFEAHDSGDSVVMISGSGSMDDIVEIDCPADANNTNASTGNGTVVPPSGNSTNSTETIPPTNENNETETNPPVNTTNSTNNATETNSTSTTGNTTNTTGSTPNTSTGNSTNSTGSTNVTETNSTSSSSNSTNSTESPPTTSTGNSTNSTEAMPPTNENNSTEANPSVNNSNSTNATEVNSTSSTSNTTNNTENQSMTSTGNSTNSTGTTPSASNATNSNSTLPPTSTGNSTNTTSVSSTGNTTNSTTPSTRLSNVFARRLQSNESVCLAFFGSFEVLLDPSEDVARVQGTFNMLLEAAVANGALQNGVDSVQLPAPLEIFVDDNFVLSPPTSAPSLSEPIQLNIPTAFLMSTSTRLEGSALEQETTNLELAFSLVTERVVNTSSAEVDFVIGSSNVTQITETKCPPESIETDICYLVLGSFQIELTDRDTDEDVTIRQFGSAALEAIDNGTLQEELGIVDEQSPFFILEGLQPSEITEAPSDAPANPTGAPSLPPTFAPTSAPTINPSNMPSPLPPTAFPSVSVVPSSIPSLSLMPSLGPTTSKLPSFTPSVSQNPSSTPSWLPSDVPSDTPSGSLDPSSTPSSKPSGSMMPSFLPSGEPSRSMFPSAQPSTASASNLNNAGKSAGGGLSSGATAGIVIAVLIIVALCGILGFFGWKNRDEYKEKYNDKFGKKSDMGKFNDDSTNDDRKFDFDDDRSKGTDDDGSVDQNKFLNSNKDLEQGGAAATQGEPAKTGVMALFAVPALFRRSKTPEDPPDTVADSRDSEKDFDKNESQSQPSSKRGSFSFFAGSKSESKRDALDGTGTDGESDNDFSDASDPINSNQKPSENESAIRQRLLADDMSSGSESEDSYDDVDDDDDDDDIPSKNDAKPVSKAATIEKDRSGGSRRSARDDYSGSDSGSESDSQSSRSYYSGDSGSSGSYSSGSGSYSSGSYSENSHQKKK